MRNYIHRVVPFLLVVLATGSTVLAQEEEKRIDGRLVGYPQQYMNEAPGTAGAWAVLIGLGIVCIGPMFLNAKRTHLD